MNTKIESYEYVIRVLARVRSPRRVLEWGPGKSTKLLARLCPEAGIVAVEHDPVWYEYWRNQGLTSVAEMRLVPLGGGYTEVDEWSFDLCLVDGRDRAECLATASRVLVAGGVAVLHDAYRVQYRPGVELFPYRVYVDCPMIVGSPRVPPPSLIQAMTVVLSAAPLVDVVAAMDDDGLWVLSGYGGCVHVVHPV